jgi:cellulose synthase operon protein C
MSPKKPGQRPEPRPAALATGSIPAIPITRAGEACARVDRVAEYLDGTLAAASQEELLTHLATCEVCQRALHGEVQLRDREDDLRAAAASSAAKAAPVSAVPSTAPAPTMPSLEAARAARRRKLAGFATAGLVTCAIAATALFVLRTRPAPHQAAPQLALAAHRPFEARLTWGQAAAHRPQAEVMRSGAKPTATAGEEISLELRASLERDRDCAGLAATYLLSGETASAQRQYAKRECPQTPDVKADHAALAVVLRDYNLALELTDAVLAEQPDHPVALWNRALALREKKLGLSAAAAFERVAATDPDPAWRAEAREKAEAARAPLEAARRQFDHAIAAGKQMVPDGPILSLELARAVPGRARLRFHDAVRTATTAARLDELRPLARALQLGDDRSLEAAIDLAKKRLAAPSAAARLALVPYYIELFRKGSVEGDAEWPAWKARALAAGADDLLLGAYYLALHDEPEAARLAAASGDPWFIGLSELDRFDFFSQLSQLNDPRRAEEALRSLEKQCERSKIGFLCLKAALSRAQLSLDSTLAPATGTAARRALELADADGEVLLRASAVYHLAEAERLRSAYSVARAYYEEYQEWARLTGDCAEQQNAIAPLAAMAFDRHRFADVRRLLQQLPPCDSPRPRALLDVQADLLTAGIEIDVQAWRSAVEEIVRRPDTTESDRLFFGYLLGRQELGADATARARLQALAERAAASAATTASRVKAAAESTVMVDAGRRGQWKKMMELAAAAHRVPMPERCALAQAKDNFQLAVVVVSSSGTLAGVYSADIGDRYDWKVDAALLDALAACEEVSVLAFPPWPSGEPPLPAALPWHFVIAETPAARPSEPAGSVVIVANSEPPADQQLANLSPIRSTPTSATVLSGAAATLARVAAEAPRASLLEFHVHTTRVAISDAPALALSESPTGWALTAEAVSGWKLSARPVVLLADCSGAVPAAYDHVAWGLPAAFLRAGAHAVVAPLVDIPDGEGGEFFAQVREELRRDPDVAKVVARLRAGKIAEDPASWVRNVVVFQ